MVPKIIVRYKEECKVKYNALQRLENKIEEIDDLGEFLIKFYCVYNSLLRLSSRKLRNLSSPIIAT